MMKRGLVVLLAILLAFASPILTMAVPLEMIVPASIVVTNEAALVAEISAGTPVITLGANIDISGPNLSIPAGMDITLEGNFILRRANLDDTGSFITVEANASLTIDGVQIEAPADVTDLGGIWVEDGAELTLLAGSISGFVSPSGGGVSVMGGSFVMHGGTISGNESTWGGGGVYVVGIHGPGSASFVMSGGEISGNTAASHGGGVYLTSATFEMSGSAVISNNQLAPSGEYGGAILLDADAFMTMYGGEISGNSGPMGGAIATHGGEFIMYDGKITGNSAVFGGAIYDEFFSSFVFNSEIRGGEISGNFAEVGGGIYVDEGAILLISNATIDDNRALLSSGVPLPSGAIGTAVYVAGSIPTGGVINAEGSGGGIYVAETGELKVTGASFIINNSAQVGGGIYTVDVADYENLTAADYQNINTASTVVFSGNSALAAYQPPPNADAEYPNIGYVTSSIRIAGTYWNPLNNFDINYVGLTPISLYTVRYFANGGTGAHTEFGLANTEYLVLSNTAAGISRINHTFTGWNTAADGSGTSYAAGTVITLTSDMDLYAQWTAGSGPGPGPGPGPIPPELPSRQAYLVGDNGLIRPNANITRAEVATILFRLITDEARVAYWMQANPFSDVALQNWFNNAVSTMTNADVFNGFSDGTFRPNQPISRAEMTAVIVRFMDEMGDLSLLGSHFSDIASHWAVEYINTAAVNGWVQGYSDGTFRPNQAITRAEATAMINRISGRLVERTEDLLPNMRTWPDNANVNEWYYFYIQAATNSYTFQRRGVDNAFERWVALIPSPDWTVLERPDSRPGDILQ